MGGQAGGGAEQGASEALDLDEASVLAEARRRAGLSDFGDDDFRPHLRVLLESLDREAALHEVGRGLQRDRIVDSLVARLRAQDWFRRFPEILDEELGAPLVIVGLARTGTTRLHRLLAQDPEVTTAAWWEVRSPSPPGDGPADAPDPRIAEARAAVEAILASSPVMAAIHPWDALGADEEIMLLEHAFLSHVPESSGNVPTYRAHVDASDLRPAYRYLERLLQFLQWQKRRRGESGRRWVLKAPFHLGYVDVLCEVFPGARIVQTHRDPVETVNSAASMYAALWQLHSEHVDRSEVGRQVQQRYAAALERCLRSRDRMPERFLDVDYRDVGRDPIGEVRRIYAFLGESLGAEAEERMRAWLSEHPREARPAHEYTLEDFGLSRDGIAGAFREYRERFIVGDAAAG